MFFFEKKNQKTLDPTQRHFPRRDFREIKVFFFFSSKKKTFLP